MNEHEELESKIKSNDRWLMFHLGIVIGFIMGAVAIIGVSVGADYFGLLD
jgi:hypothetical protein